MFRSYDSVESDINVSHVLEIITFISNNCSQISCDNYVVVCRIFKVRDLKNNFYFLLIEVKLKIREKL